MGYKEKLQIKLYEYINSAFVLQAIIDDYQEISFTHNLYEAGDFTITINYNIPNALKFQRGMFIQFGNNNYMFGEILTINDAIGEDGKGSQIRTITGKDARFIFKRRIIKNLNNESNWSMTAKGEICLRNLVNDQCGSNAEEKRQLPITNIIPTSENAIGDEYSVSESFSNLYDTLVTIATQSKIGWRVKFDGGLTLEIYEGTDLSAVVQFSTDFDSLANGEFSDSAESFANSIYVGGKGTGNDRDIYEGESAIEGNSPSGLDRYEAWDNQSSMTSESEYAAEALSMLTQYGQTIEVSGNGLAKSPYEFQKEYNIGDIITLAFSGKSAKAQILSVVEHWAWGEYNIEFSFGKPQNDLSRQLQLILKQIQKASNKTTTTSSVKWYTIPTDTIMKKSEVVYDTIGFVGACAEDGSTFQLYWDSEKTGAKTYHVWLKQLGGGKLTLTTGVTGKQNLVMDSGTYVAIIYVDQEGNVLSQSATATNTIQTGNTQPATSGGVADAISTAVETAEDLSNATGILPLANGGTGQTSQIAAASVFGGIARCTEAAGTAAKTATCYGYKLVAGQTIKLYITNTNTASNPTLNIASTGAKSIYVNGVAANTSNLTSGWWVVVYDGTAYQLFSADLVPALGCAVCLTASGTAVKVATMPGFSLVTGSVFLLYLKIANTASSPKLNINGTGEKPIYVNNAAATTSNLTAGIYLVRYNGTNYYIDKEYAVMSARSAGTATNSYNTFSLDKALTCSTAAGTAAKTVSLSGFSLTKGARLIINLQNANTAASALTLNVNETGAKTIRWNGSVTSATVYAMTAGYYNCYYDGTYWNMDNGYEAYSARNSNSANISAKTRTRACFTCSTAAGTVAKTVSVSSYGISTRDEILIYFSNTNTASAPTLNVNSTGAKPIKIFNTNPNNTNKLLVAGTYLCMYDGTNWNLTPYGTTNLIETGNMQAVTSEAVAGALKTENIEGSVLTLVVSWVQKYTVDIRRIGNLAVVNMFFSITSPVTLTQNTVIGNISLKPLDYVRVIGINENNGYALKVEILSDGSIVFGPFGGSISLSGAVRCESIIYGIEG